MIHSSVSYRKIINIALPMLAANISIPLLGVVDTAILGHLDDAIYLSSVALGSHTISLLLWSFGFLRMGTTGFTSRAKGASDKQAIDVILAQSIGFGLAAAIVLILLHPIYLPLLFELLADSGQLRDYAINYAEIRIWGAIPALLTYSITGWLIGLQQVRLAMLIFIAINLINIALDYVLIVLFDLNVSGAALATLIAEYCGLLIGLYLVFIKLGYKPQLLNVALIFNAATLIAMFVSSRQLFIRTLCLLLVFLFFTSRGVALGDDVAAANAILLSLLALTAYLLDSFAYSSETLCGEAWGANNYQLLINSCIKTTQLSVASAVVITLALIGGQSWLIALYTDLPAVITVIDDIYLLLALMPLIGVWSYQFDGIFIGVGKTQVMQNMMLVATFGVYFPLWWLTSYYMNDANLALWFSFIGFMVVRGISLGLALKAIKQID